MQWGAVPALRSNAPHMCLISASALGRDDEPCCSPCGLAVRPPPQGPHCGPVRRQGLAAPSRCSPPPPPPPPLPSTRTMKTMRARAVPKDARSGCVSPFFCCVHDGPPLGTPKLPSHPPPITPQASSVTLQPPSVTLQPPSVTLQPPSVTLERPLATLHGGHPPSLSVFRAVRDRPGQWQYSIWVGVGGYRLRFLRNRISPSCSGPSVRSVLDGGGQPPQTPFFLHSCQFRPNRVAPLPTAAPTVA